MPLGMMRSRLAATSSEYGGSTGRMRGVVTGLCPLGSGAIVFVAPGRYAFNSAGGRHAGNAETQTAGAGIADRPPDHGAHGSARSALGAPRHLGASRQEACVPRPPTRLRRAKPHPAPVAAQGIAREPPPPPPPAPEVSPPPPCASAAPASARAL